MKRNTASHRKSKALNSVIIVKYGYGTYTAAWDGEKTSCTAGPEMAAQRLARKTLGKDVELKRVPDERHGYYRYEVCS